MKRHVYTWSILGKVFELFGLFMTDTPFYFLIFTLSRVKKAEMYEQLNIRSVK
jgi:hypothetical protein